ncbi:MAG TPA: SIMPL domain-containing protein [Anaerolineales bacterium]|nr:SIMPL domain-containing protein [Anaerolineales bacterium]
MKRSTLLLAVLLPAAIILSACGPATVVANPGSALHSLSVTGMGTVELTPDIAYINIGVHTEAPTAAEAVATNNTQTQQVVDALKTAGVASKDIRTSNFSIYPNTQYDPQTNQKIGTTYMVDNTVYVTVRDLGNLGALLDAAVKSGANNVNSIQFDVADKDPATKQARDAAVKDAQTQAQELAKAAGVTLGEIQTITYNNSIPTPIMQSFGKGAGGAADLAVPINPGTMTLTVTVGMAYEIKQ